ncbi:MAG: SapC family protein, partial [Halieaceae bacterium]
IGQHTVEDGEQVRLLSIDLAHPRVSRSEEGDALFQPLGGRTEYLEHIADILETIHEGAEQTRRFTQCLAEWQLIESVTMDITLRDGSKNQLLGYSTVNEDAVRGLSGEQLATLTSEGFLMPLFMMLASMSNLRRLIDLKEKRQSRTP